MRYKQGHREEAHARMLADVLKLQTVVMAGLGEDEKAVMGRCLELIQANLAALGAPATAP